MGKKQPARGWRRGLSVGSSGGGGSEPEPSPVPPSRRSVWSPVKINLSKDGSFSTTLSEHYAMTIHRVAVIFDNTQRPETTGTYCLRA